MGLENTEFCVTEVKVSSDNEIYQKEEKNASVEITIKAETADSSTEYIKNPEELVEKESISRNARLVLFILCIITLIVGRFGVPDEEFANVKDRVMDALQGMNDFINRPGNELYRDLMQMINSFLIDVVFICTFAYWVIRGKNARLPITLGIFYVVRALVQQIWVSPFPEGFYWDAPLLPSLVVPYGRGSDFFFSGHSGFLVICAAEWHKLKFPKMRNFSICVLLYTVFVLLTYRIHYSIDIFTGVIFAEWTFGKVDSHLESILNFFSQGFTRYINFFTKRYSQMIDGSQAMSKDVCQAAISQV